MIKILELNLSYTSYMMEHNLDFDDRFDPTQGISFFIKGLDDLIPFLFSVLFIFILSVMYCTIYADHMDIHYLLPYSDFSKELSRLMTAIMIGLFLLLTLTGVSILCGIAGNTLGNLDLPVLKYTQQGPISYVPFRSICSNILMLQFLSMIFIANFISFISVLTKNSKTCMIMGLIFVIGGMLITTNIVPSYPISYLLPTTYIQSLKVMSGELMYITGNLNINFSNGVIVLSISSLLLFFASHLLIKIQKNKGRGLC